MRVVIFCDMEGVSCIETWEQVTGGTALYAECRKLYTDEVNAAVRGARAAGASDVIVVDCHGAGGAYSFKALSLNVWNREHSTCLAIPGRVISQLSSRDVMRSSLLALMQWRARPMAFSATPSRQRPGTMLALMILS